VIVPLCYSNPRTIPPGLLIRSANLHLNGSNIKENERKKRKKEKAVEGLCGKKDADPITRRGVRFRSVLSVYGARNQINATTRHRRRPSEGGVRQLLCPWNYYTVNRRAREICAEAWREPDWRAALGGYSFPIVEIVGAKARPTPSRCVPGLHLVLYIPLRKEALVLRNSSCNSARERTIHTTETFAGVYCTVYIFFITRHREKESEREEERDIFQIRRLL
jgi:hypothetical protein